MLVEALIIALIIILAMVITYALINGWIRIRLRESPSRIPDEPIDRGGSPSPPGRSIGTFFHRSEKGARKIKLEENKGGNEMHDELPDWRPINARKIHTQVWVPKDLDEVTAEKIQKVVDDLNRTVMDLVRNATPGQKVLD
jgi:hypothetical protein